MALMNNTSSVAGKGEWTFGSCQFNSHVARFDAFLYIFIAIIAAAGSLIVFVCYSRHRALRSSTNVFIISLSASDLLVAVISIPYSFGVFLCQWRPPVDERALEDLAYLTCDMLPSILSIYSLCFVAIDRGIAVTNPFFHTKYVHQKSAGIAVVIMWGFVTSLVAFIYILDRNDFTLFIIFLSYIIPVVVMVTSYSIMAYVAKQHAEAINLMERTSLRLLERSNTEKGKKVAHNNDLNADMEINQGNGSRQLTIKVEKKGTLRWLRDTFCRRVSQDDDDRNYDKKGGLSLIKREFKAALTLSLLLGVFIIAWTPFMALNMRMYSCPTCIINYQVVKYFKILHYSNSALNPFLYIILNKRWRVAFQVTLFCVKKRSRVSEATMSELAAW